MPRDSEWTRKVLLRDDLVDGGAAAAAPDDGDGDDDNGDDDDDDRRNAAAAAEEEDDIVERMYTRPSDADAMAIPIQQFERQKRAKARKVKRAPAPDAAALAARVADHPLASPAAAAAAAADDDEEGLHVAAPACDDAPTVAPASEALPAWTSINADDPPSWVADLPPTVRDELAFVVAVYPEAAVFAVQRGFGGGGADNSLAAAAAMAAGAVESSVCECSGNGDAGELSSLLSHVARLALRIDGENVIVMLSALVPRGFGSVAGCNPTFEVRSPNAARVVVGAVEDTLAAEVAEQCRDGTFSFLTLVGRASELVSEIPLGMQSNIFGFCLKCASEASKRAKAQRDASPDPSAPSATQRKYPQPLRIIESGDAATRGLDEGAAAPDEPSVLAAVRRATARLNTGTVRIPAPVYECLVCHSIEHVVRIESLQPNVEDAPCSFCYFEDNPIIRIAGCGCRTCFTCFSSFTTLATGSNQLRRCPRTGWVGVPCPAHSRSSVIADPPLYKLCETASFLRFNRFALQLTTQELNASDCADPRCSGIPTIANISGDKRECSTCNEWTCGTCNAFLRECGCEDWPTPATRDHKIRSDAELISRRAESIGGDLIESRKVTMLVRFGHLSHPVVLGTTDPVWMTDCRRQLAQAQYDAPKITSRTAASDTALFIIFHGVPLDGSRPLGVFPVYDGAIVYAVVRKDLLNSKSLPSERDLFAFRVAIRATRDGKKPENVAAAEESIYKRCPQCTKPVVHYYNHGCHHIGFASAKCCGNHWCYVCRGPFPCLKCPLMCNIHCGCPACPDCKPQMPCANCWGCPQCRGGGPGTQPADAVDFMFH